MNKPKSNVAEVSAGSVMSSDFYRTLLESMSEGVSLSDETGKIIYTNPAEDRMFGYAAGELVGEHVSIQNAYPPEENARVVEGVIAELKRSGEWQGEWLNRRKDDTTFVTKSRISAVEIDARPHWLCVQEDISEQSQAAEELRLSKARLELATSAASLGIWDWDVPTGRMTYSARAKDICGFDPDHEVTYEDARAVTHPEDYPRTSAMARRALDPSICEVRPYEYRIVRPDGQIRWVIANGEAVFADDAGKVRAVRYVGTIRDITERKQAEQSLLEQASILTQLVEGVIVADADGRLTYVNEAAARLHGVAELGVQPEQYSDAYHLFTEDGRPHPKEELPLFRALGGETIEEARWRIHRPDGTSILAIGSARPILDRAGVQTGAVLTLRDDTARDAAERELRDSDTRMRNIMNALPAFVWLAHPDGELHHFNDQWYEYTGQTPDQALPNGWTDTLHPDDVQVTAKQWAEALEAGKIYENECRYRSKEGDYRWHVARATPLRNDEGSVIAWFGTSTDIHARKEAELSLTESEARFRGVFNSRLTGLAVFDANTSQTLAINDTFLAMTGHSRADFEQGQWDWREFTVPKFLNLDKAAIVQARERGCWDTYEKEYRRRDGSRFPVRVSSAPMLDEPGRVVVSVQDISSVRGAEAELRESQQRLQLAQQAAGIGVWDWNLVTDAITWSPEMFDLLDIDPLTPPQQLFGAWTAAVHPDDREQATSTVEHSAKTAKAFSTDFRIARRDGEVRWLRSQAVGVLEEDGRPIRLTGINVDVTAQHRTEQALRREATKLSEAIEERTRERNRVFELSSELIGAADFEGYLKTINPAWERLLGYSEAELLARPSSSLSTPTTVQRLRRSSLIWRTGRPCRNLNIEWFARTASPSG